MEKIIINPSEVRGLGNIVSPKQTSDFMNINGVISSGSDPILGTVFSDSYLAGAKLSLIVDRYISSSTESFSVGATLKNSSNTVISGATLYLDVNGTVLSATTDESGVASFTVDTDGSHEYVLKCFYRGSVSVGGVFCNTSVVVIGTPTSLELQGTTDICQSGDNIGLWATLLDDEGEPIPYASVSFYEEWTPAIRLSANPSVIQSGGDTDLTAQLIDSSDGSLVREAGHTVNFYRECTSIETFKGMTFTGAFTHDAPTYTQTDSKITITNSFTTSGAPIMIAPLGIFDEEYSFEFKIKSSSASTKCFFGIQTIIDNTKNANAQKGVCGIRYDGSNMRSSFTSSSSGSYSNGGYISSDTSEHTVKFTVNGDAFKFYIDGTEKAGTNTLDWINNPLQLNLVVLADDGATIEVSDFKIYEEE